MTIASVACHLLSYPLAEPLRIPHPGGECVVFKRDAMVIRVQTASGLAGFAPGPPDEASRRVVEETIAPFLTGRFLGDPDALRVHFHELHPHAGPQLLALYGAVEIALFDLLGKARGVPVSELLGGRVRDRVRLYSSALFPCSPEHAAELALACADSGTRALKLRAGHGPRRDGQAVELARRAAGANFDLMFDAKACWRDVPSLYPPSCWRDLAAELNDYAVAWIEDPLPPGAHDQWRAWKQLDYAPLAGGSLEPDEFQLLDLVFSDSIDYLQLDLVNQGGFWAARRVLPEAAHAGLRFCFHGCATPLEMAAAVQLAVCWPEMVAEWLEAPRWCEPGYPALPLLDDLLIEPLDVREGWLAAPSGAGLGLKIDERAFALHPWLPGPASENRLAHRSEGSAA